MKYNDRAKQRRLAAPPHLERKRKGSHSCYPCGFIGGVGRAGAVGIRFFLF